MKNNTIKEFGRPGRQSISKSAMGSGMILLSNNTVVQMMNERTIQIMTGVMLLLALVVVLIDHKKNKKTDAEDAE